MIIDTFDIHAIGLDERKKKVDQKIPALSTHVVYRTETCNHGNTSGHRTYCCASGRRFILFFLLQSKSVQEHVPKRI